MHTVKRVCTLVLTGLLALPMAAPAGAAAASFSDLPSSHWAYIAMTEAASWPSSRPALRAASSPA